MKGGNLGSSRDCQDRFIQSQDSTVVNVFQQKYWKTKQTLVKVPGNKEDEYVVMSDADLDKKLEVFHSIQRTCMDLLRVTEQYQKRIYFLSQEEKELGHFLRSQDKSRAGKIMQATGKALCFCSQQRLALRKPLCRLYQEVETFRYRSISDTWLTVNRMEQSRTRYQGALLWMKDVSQELDPDIHKQMEQFRKVQAQVRTTKTSFDKLKNDVCQKVDLLGANRCNLLSHVLTTYQTTLLHFWEKTSHTMAAIHESFRGCQQYEFSTLENLQDTMDKVAKKKTKKQEEEGIKMEIADEQLISLINESTTDKTREEAEEKDNMASLKEILGTLSLDTEAGTTAASDRPAEAQQKEDPLFLPSQLLDHSVNNPQFSLSDWTGFMESLCGANQSPVEAAVKETTGSSKDLSAWFNLFASLDPFSDPDVVGKTDAERERHNA